MDRKPAYVWITQVYTHIFFGKPVKIFNMTFVWPLNKTCIIPGIIEKSWPIAIWVQFVVPCTKGGEINIKTIPYYSLIRFYHNIVFSVRNPSCANGKTTLPCWNFYFMTIFSSKRNKHGFVCYHKSSCVQNTNNLLYTFSAKGELNLLNQLYNGLCQPSMFGSTGPKSADMGKEGATAYDRAPPFPYRSTIAASCSSTSDTGLQSSPFL